MRLSSNLLKRQNIVSKDERVIDYNEIIRARVEKLRERVLNDGIDMDGFTSGLDAEVVEPLLDENGEPVENAAVIQAAPTMENIRAEVEAANAEAQQLREETQQQIQEMLEAANEQAESIKQQAYQDGMAEGLQNAQAELDQQKQKLVLEYAEKAKELEKEYEQKKAQMEPELVEVLLEVFKKVIGTIAQDQEDMIVNLINSVMQKSDSNRSFIIKVSPEDYKFLLNNQGKIYCAMTNDIQLDIVEDLTMEKNQCIIETENGVYDCGLDIQLENLIHDMKLLSCI